MDTSEALSVLENSACKKATAKVMDAQVAFAVSICEKLEQMEIREVVVPGYGRLRRVGWQSNVGGGDYLASPIDGYALDMTYGPDGRYMHGDVNCWVRFATRAERLAFAQSANAILIAIKETELGVASELSALADHIPVSA